MTPSQFQNFIVKIVLASGGAGGRVRVFTLSGSGGGSDVVRSFPGHSDYVNDLAFQPSEGEPEILATGGVRFL